MAQSQSAPVVHSNDGSLDRAQPAKPSAAQPPKPAPKPTAPPVVSSGPQTPLKPTAPTKPTKKEPTHPPRRQLAHFLSEELTSDDFEFDQDIVEDHLDKVLSQAENYLKLSIVKNGGGSNPAPLPATQRLAHYLTLELSPLDFERDPAALEERIALLIDQAHRLFGQPAPTKPSISAGPRYVNPPQTQTSLAPSVLRKPIPPKHMPEVPQSLFRSVAETLPSDAHRERNEDSWFALPDVGAAAVFDGVSAAREAALASQRANEELTRLLNHKPSTTNPGDLQRFIGESLQSTNRILVEMNQAGGNDRVATTGALVLVTKTERDRALVYGTVGDSRIYLWHTNSQRLELAALDDSLLRLLLVPADQRPSWVGPILTEAGVGADLVLTPPDVAKLATILDKEADPAHISPLAKLLFGERNLVTQSLGLPSITPHTGLLQVEPGDRVLLATDGIHDNLTEGEIIQILKSTALTETASALVVRAHEVATSQAPRAKMDDMTAIVLEIL